MLLAGIAVAMASLVVRFRRATGLERLQLNEATLWAGRPYDPVNPQAANALPRVVLAPIFLLWFGLGNFSTILLVGFVAAVLPHAVAILFGRYVLKMNPLILLGACSGAGTMTAALRALQEEVVTCRACPRLVAWREQVAHEREHGGGIVALRPDRDGQNSGYSGVDEAQSRLGEWVIDAHLPPPGTPTQPVEAGYMANAYVRMRHPDYDVLRELLDDVGRTVHVYAQ